MFNRRLFLRAGLVGAASPVMLHAVPAAAAGADPVASDFAGNLFYTSENPGRWAGKEAGHAPQIERSATNIEVRTPHEMNGYVHYIIKHQIFDENLNFVEEILFDPELDEPTTEHSISGLEGRVYAVSMCNLHDVWVTSFTL